MSPSELEARGGLEVAEVANPLTGELVDLNGPTDQLAAAVDAVKEQKSRLDEFASSIKGELLARMDHEAKYSYGGGGFKVSGDGPRQPDYDGERLYAGLRPLVEAGEISREAMKNAVHTEVVYKPRKVGINALKNLPSEGVQAAVKAAEIPNDKPRQVRVTRDNG